MVTTDSVLTLTAAREVIELEDMAEGLRATIKAAMAEVATEYADVANAAASCEQRAEELRAAMATEYDWRYELALQADQELDLPAGLAFQQRKSVMAVAPELLPREALAPVKRLLKEGMPGTETVRVWHPVITAKKVEGA